MMNVKSEYCKMLTKKIQCGCAGIDEYVEFEKVLKEINIGYDVWFAKFQEYNINSWAVLMWERRKPDGEKNLKSLVDWLVIQGQNAEIYFKSMN